MIKPKFPGMENIKVDEGLLMVKMLKKDGHDAEDILEFLTCVDECLVIQRSASLINRFRGKQKYNNKMAKDLIYERAARLELKQCN